MGGLFRSFRFQIPRGIIETRGTGDLRSGSLFDSEGPAFLPSLMNDDNLIGQKTKNYDHIIVNSKAKPFVSAICGLKDKIATSLRSSQ
jgi:hypothetical protein